MDNLTDTQASTREKTLLVALLLSMPGPLLTGIAALSGGSASQLADFIRRGVELVALFLAWWVFHALRQKVGHTEADRVRLERVSGLGVAGTIFCSGVVILFVALSRSTSADGGSKVAMSLTIAMLGLLVNGSFWLRYKAMTREQYSAVISGQEQLYRAKVSVDLCVVLALTALVLAPTHPATRYADMAGSLVVATYLLWSGLRQVRVHWRASIPVPNAPNA